MHLTRKCSLVAAGVLAGLVLGCADNEEIHRYRAPQAETIEGSASAGKSRMIGAIVPHGDRTWFFKLVGPVELIEEHRQQFDRFLESVHFTGDEDEPVTWTVPDGWREERGRGGMRYAAFHLVNDDSVEFTVTTFDQAAGGVLANVNRWRKQLDLAPVKDSDLPRVTHETRVDGTAATVVDMTGTGSGKTRMPPFAGGAAPFAGGRGEGAEASLKYMTPAGWKEVPDPKGVRKLLFDVTEGGQSAEVGVTTFGGGGGGLAANINRWRSQLGLTPASEEQLRKEVRQINVAGKPAAYVDLTGRGQRILGVVAEHGGLSWFITMKGPADLVGKHKAAFETFLGSVRFSGGGGANDG